VDLKWKRSFISKAKKYNKDVIRVYIDGRNLDFFYNLSNWRNKIGVKFNLEILYLVDEFFAQRNHRVTIRVGKRIPYTAFDNSRNEKQWAAEVKQLVYDLKTQK